MEQEGFDHGSCRVTTPDQVCSMLATQSRNSGTGCWLLRRCADRQAQDQIGPSPVGQVLAFGTAPPQGWRGICHVDHQGKDLVVLLLAQRVVEPLDGQAVGVGSHHVIGVFRRDSRVEPHVAAQVPDQPAGSIRGGGPDEVRLAGLFLLIVALAGPIVRPGAATSPIQLRPTGADVGSWLSGALRGSRPGDLPTQVGARLGRGRACRLLQMDMYQDAGLQEVAEGHQALHWSAGMPSRPPRSKGRKSTLR